MVDKDFRGNQSRGVVKRQESDPIQGWDPSGPEMSPGTDGADGARK